jgi:Domain of unknown function (DUF4062)
MKKMYQVFISSTYKDLEEERFEVMQALLKMGCMPAGMELFPAANESQWNFIKRVIDESDYYLLIVGGKYGSVHPQRGISYTRMEYEYALETKKPILRFLVKDATKLPQEKIEKDPKIIKKLDDFKKFLLDENLCQFYNNPHDLALKVTQAINQLREEYPALGWIKANNVVLESAKEAENKIFDFDDVKVQIEKTVYYKIVNLKSVQENPEIIYEKYIPRVISHFRSRDRTDGSAIELYSLFPFKGSLDDGDKRATLIEPVILGPSDTFVSSGHTYNGFKAGDLDLGLKVEKNTNVSRLVIDFSSIPNFEDMISENPKLYYNHFPTQSTFSASDKMIDQEISGYKVLAPGIFFAELENMKKEEALRFEFSIDIDKISNLT